ncbi:alpha/beta hydrolase [Thalassomonas actiniarum]|uniref:alpha/beta hydrolase n=1 Tax=Thalassomonas actiniarum TaxID=485447 RepID=UPI00069DBC81|nr:alpha/beta hydrolase [Thalassomonas actiniarum]
MTCLDEQFNLRKRHPLGRVHLLANKLQSCVARLTLRKSLDISYGHSSGEKVDIFPAAHPNAPVFFFIHGGYFRALDKRQYNYIAKPFVAAGCTVVLINYDLAPAVSVKDIIGQNIKAFKWVRENISRWNGNPGNIVLCGHSVGAFLVAKILEFDWEQEVRQSISGAALLSGLYDLSNMKQSYLNKSVRLSDDDVATLSPMFADTSGFPSVIVAVGEDETEEFVEQSQTYAKKLQASKSLDECLLLKSKNHYTVSRLLGNRNNALMKKILGMCAVN